MGTLRKSIALLPAEQLLRELVLDCAQHFPGLEIWVAGGWVRDRLLGIPSSDLDLALSKVTGREFGKVLQSFTAVPENEARYREKAAELGIPDVKFTRFHIMEKNVDKAKHLETAGGRLFGLDVDLVNLRKEVYDGHSRTPEMDFGTPEEDAFRRDATVNSLLFHFKKQEVVDLTGKGLEDLEARIMRTPLDPYQTFMDDPLRVLRLIRIGSKLSFTIDPAAMRCMRDERIQQALNTKITRERVGIEVFKMMQGPHPTVAFQHIFEANLYSPVFVRLDSPLVQELQAAFPHEYQSALQSWPTTWPRAHRLLSRLLEHVGNIGKLVQSDPHVEHLWAMAAFAPFAVLRQEMPRQAVEEAAVALRAPNRLSKLLDSALKNFDSILTIVSATASKTQRLPTRSAVGMAIRSWGATWTTQATYVMLASVVCDSEKASPSGSYSKDSSVDDSLEKSILAEYSAFADFVADNDLAGAHLQRPLLDGKQIQKLFGLQKGGKYLKTALDDLVAWQFDHAGGGIEEAKAWLLGRRGSLGIPADDASRS
ncbi:Poly A polymerase, head domain protein [Moelleriella libera RCEF 2490]|uniref:Poly A polymerase, head domain protein n=1 Tax=Moelleriella libera RCEF 2490 TaxID=1081109 RepID=A0A166PAU6_9HYPO|nr:Poly A polymerase, head domain protein [Moelleriella libera RCEF 2490]